MSKVLEFPSDSTFRKWLEENRYAKYDHLTSIWSKQGKCVGGTFVKHENGERTWTIVMY